MRRVLLAVACAVFAGTIAIVAQQTPTFRTRVDTVDVHVTVRDENGRLVPDLTQDDFELYDNGKRRDIVVFSSARQPIAVSLLLDRSGSIAGQATKVLEAAEAFTGELLPDDRVAVNTLSFECLPLTAEKTKLQDALRHMDTMDFGSPIWAGLDRTMTTLAGEAGRRAILLFSDGNDAGSPMVNGGTWPLNFPLSQLSPCKPWTNPSEAGFLDALKRAQRDGVMVYTVSVEDARGHTNDGDLRTIAQKSGGERYKLKQADELSGAFRRIADELHHQYLLGFVPALYDGKVHELDVRVKKPGLTVRARKSYVADRNEGPNALRTPPVPIPPLTPDDVDAAVRNGAAGQKLQAACSASGAFADRPEESQAMATVVLEGPTGRIMRAAREARQQRQPFGASDVPDEMRQPAVQVTAEIRTTVPAPDRPASDPAATANDPATAGTIASPQPMPVRPRAIASLMSLLVRSKVQTEITLTPDSDPATRPRLGWTPQNKLIGFLDLAAFRALPGPDVEVLVRSVIGTRRCTITEKDRASVR